MDGLTSVPEPINEAVRGYAPDSSERASLQLKLTQMWAETPDLPHVIGGQDVAGTGKRMKVVAPFEHRHAVGKIRSATPKDAAQAIDAAMAAAPAWRDMSFDDRAAIFLRAADLAAGPYRDVLNGATMLGQAKTAQQAEIDSACELIDFWRFNVAFAQRLYAEQPYANSPGTWNRTDHRALEGFVYAITPFNFTAIAGNLPTAPALMGNTVVWKPSHTQALAAHYVMEVLRKAGLPDGVINLLHGEGAPVSESVVPHRDLAGIHFTGSTRVFQMLWKQVADNITGYRTYPRLVGETGGKDFIVAHSSADVDVLRTAMVRGAFEYSGQKCSAASRAYVPRSVWRALKPSLVDVTESLAVGSPLDFSNFTSAVIDDRSFAKQKAAIDRAHATSGLTVLAGGTYDDSEGYFVRPTIVEAADPREEMMSTEYFGPILTVHVYPDRQFEKILDVVDSTSEYALTGAVIADDRTAIAKAAHALRYAAGNFYINDKPTGAVVGQQPFGGARGSGTNDKAGAMQNLLRWTSTRSIKETFVPPVAHTYPHMG